VKGALHPSNTKRLYIDEKLGEINEKKNRKVKGSIKTPASIAIQVIEVHNSPHHVHKMTGVFYYVESKKL